MNYAQIKLCKLYKSILVGLLIVNSGIICTKSYSQCTVDLDTGLLASYPFNGNADDITGNGNNGTAFNGVSLTTDRFGASNAAFEFDGIDDYINTFSTFDYPERTLSLWIQPYSIIGAGGSGTVLIHVAITQDDNALNYGILRVHVDNGILTLFSGGIQGTYSQSISANNWVHLVLVRNGTINQYYVDGVLVGNTVADGGGSTFNPVDDFIIGAGRSTTNQFYQGKIDDILIYERALNECEVAELFNPTPPVVTTAIPTMGEWGLICLLLLFLIGLVSSLNYKNASKALTN